MQDVWGVDIEESKNFILIYIIIFFITYAVSKVITVKTYFKGTLALKAIFCGLIKNGNSGILHGLSNGPGNNKFLLFG